MGQEDRFRHRRGNRSPWEPRPGLRGGPGGSILKGEAEAEVAPEAEAEANKYGVTSLQ